MAYADKNLDVSEEKADKENCRPYKNKRHRGIKDKNTSKNQLS